MSWNKYKDEDLVDSQSKTYAEFDLKKIILAQAQSFSQAVQSWRAESYFKKGRYKIYRSITVSFYLKLCANIDNPQMLSKITEDERKYLLHYEKEFKLITPEIAWTLNKIINKMLNKYGLTDLSSQSGDYI